MRFLGPLALLALALGCRAPAAVRERPNVLLLITDDQRDDFLGCAGHPVLRTPTIDGLAARGVRFVNAFVTTPICAASRASILTGQWERRHGYTFGTPPLSADEIAGSYPTRLRAAGYRTGFVGKYGVQAQGDSPQVLYDFFRAYTQPFRKTLADGSVRHLTDIAQDDALEFLSGCEPGRPFCLTVSFNAPHAEDATKDDPYPGSPPEAALYVDDELPPPLVPSDFWTGLPEFFAGSLNRERWFWRWDTPEKTDRFQRDYYRMISGIDRVIGRLMAELEARGLARNTVVIFTSDNGYYLGSRGFAGKWSHFEESLRVPLVIHDPRLDPTLAGRRAEVLALNVDLAPTILDLAGVPAPSGVQGASLVPILRGLPVPDWREDFLFEHLYDHPRIPRMEGVRGSRYVYSRYVDHLPEGEFLHDLGGDPLELTNLASDPRFAQRLERMRRRCDELVAAAATGPDASAPRPGR
jgi:arylsulfatase A-like enzyme